MVIAQLEVLEFLAAHPEDYFSSNEIAEKMGIDLNSARHYLYKLKHQQRVLWKVSNSDLTYSNGHRVDMYKHKY